jgi:hypothetical protein
MPTYVSYKKLLSKKEANVPIKPNSELLTQEGHFWIMECMKLMNPC